MDPKAGAARRGDGRLQLSLQVLWDAMVEWNGIWALGHTTSYNNVSPTYFAMYNVHGVILDPQGVKYGINMTQFAPKTKL